MRPVVSDERGMTLVELLAAITLLGVIMGATLGTFTQFEQTTGTNFRQNDAQDQVRVGLAGIARELRNLASPTDEQPEAIVRATGPDLVFQSVSSTVTRRVRYCLDTAGNRLWRQVQFEPFSVPSAACPDSAWGSERTAVQHVVNGERPVFGYNVEDPLGITEISTTIWVDVNPGTKPIETSLQTSIFLRNQNRSPTASFTATQNGASIVLNGSLSSDPEGRALQFYWYDAGETEHRDCGEDGPPAYVPQTDACIGVGVVSTYTPSSGGLRHVYLVVSDPASLTHQAPQQSVCVPDPDPEVQC